MLQPARALSNSTRVTFELSMGDEDAMAGLGARLAQLLAPGDVVLLSGGLGAGKTTLARSVIGALTGDTDVPSPTYTLVQTYEAEEFEVWHADLYRLDSPDDVLPLGLLDMMDEVISLIEWPDRLGRHSPTHALHVEIAFDGKGRRVVLRGDGWDRRLEEAGF